MFLFLLILDNKFQNIILATAQRAADAFDRTQRDIAIQFHPGNDI